MAVTSTVVLASNSPQADLALLSEAELSAAADGMPGDADSPSGTLAALGLEAAEWIASECGISGIGGNPPTLKQEDLVETFRIAGTGPRSLILARGFVSDVTVAEDGAELAEGTDFAVSAGAGIVRRLSGDAIVAWAPGTVVVSYTAGFVEAPPLVKSVASDYVRMKLAQRDRDPLERSETAEGLGTLSYRDGGAAEGGFAETARDRLRRYVRPVV